MCGIAGFVHATVGPPVERERLQAMIDVLRHRGPDGDGVHLGAQEALGHRRLAIIDLEGGRQPMATTDGSLVITFNGEIYNYVELKAELESLGHHFRTTSDTEVILHAYRQWGVDCQQHFNGMWAFALWDDARKRLLLSRDRLGEKPLYYSLRDGTLVFGSEIKSLFAYGLPREPDLQWIEVYVALSFVPAPYSFFKGISKLPPATGLVFQDGRIDLRSYWDLPQVSEGEMDRERARVEKQFAELLTDSVRIRMRSDVPYGAFLSGGLDSGAITAIMSTISSHPVRTFTIGFTQADYDERHLACQVAAAFGTRHHEYEVQPDALEEGLDRVVKHYDEPFGDVSAIPTALVSRVARQEVKMVLSGDGGDEVLSGYTMYQGERFAAGYQKLPVPLQRLLPGVAGAAAGLLWGRPRFRLNRVRNVCRASALPFHRRLIEKIAWAEPSLITRLLRPYAQAIPVEEYIRDVLGHCSYHDPFYKLMYYHLKISLPDKMLVKVDRMSMAYSLEVRTPFLDHRLVELLARTDKRVKMRGYERKTILRDTVAKRLPPALLKAPKQGFAVPVWDWFQGEVDPVIETGGLHLEPGAKAELLQRNSSGREDYGNLIWILMVLDRVLRRCGE